MYLFPEPKSSFHPLLKPRISPGTNPMPAPIGNPEAAIEECVANFDAVSLRVCIARVVTFANIDLMATSIAVHLTSIQPLYDRNAKPATNNPTTTAAIFMTFLIAYPATIPNRNPPPAEKKKVLGWQIRRRSLLSESVCPRQVHYSYQISDTQIATIVSLPVRKPATEVVDLHIFLSSHNHNLIRT